MTETRKIAIIGAGITGLSCGRKLQNAGHDVVLIDKGRGIGGRIATRRAETLRFDHGAQYIKARSERFQNVLFEAEQAYAAAEWNPVYSSSTPAEDEKVYVGMPSMSAFTKYLAENLDVQTSTRVVELQRQRDSWALGLEDDSCWGDFDCVAVTAPPVQAYELVSSFSSDFNAIQSVVMAPCWAGLYAFQNKPDIPFDVYRSKSDAVAWAAFNTSKPAREASSYCWVIHASRDWTRSHLNETKEDIAVALLKEFGTVCDIDDFGPTLHATAHRWLYAFVENPLGAPFIYDQDIQLAVAGDWCLGPRVEAGFQSGDALADAIIQNFK